MSKDESAEAIHLPNGDQHIVGIKALKVLLSNDCGMWFAQGLEIDYASAGETIEEAKVNFESGLKKTVTEHLKLHGSIDNLLKIAPQEVWDEYYGTQYTCERQKYSTIQFHDLCSDKELVSNKTYFPFKEIAFIEQEAA